ncbi:Disease resistance protein family [Melia azedarach]|uniref:Disease resistance protein family n=1 Tax=Melia azedarach TaxID=155640 RepID=A0ACC1Y463_MELAZ|nr:Disease resistance protein family [Melia azedarach]
MILWNRVDLLKVGIPPPGKDNSSKIIFTTRFAGVCGLMEANREFKVNCLAHDEAWKLFQTKVGKETLDSHPDIPELAQIVAKECGGFPLTLITIGRAMAFKKTPEEWEDAIRVLRTSASKFPGVLNEYDQGYSIIGDLHRACLLEEDDDYHLKMHDIVRDLAVWIASEFEKEKEIFFVQADAGLSDAPEIGKWEGIRRLSLMRNQIQSLSKDSYMSSSPNSAS